MWQKTIVIAALAALVALPFALRTGAPGSRQADDVVVIITPHNEAIRYEFSAGFQRWYRAKTNRTVFVDWRVIGGTNEIVRFLRSEYTMAFENFWRREQKHEWNNDVQAAVMNEQLRPGPRPEDDTPAEAARRAFLASDVGIGIDLFFGGGRFDFEREARVGRIVDSGILQRHPEWFCDGVIPQQYAGESYWELQGRWIGTVVSNYGLLVNRDSLQRLGVPEPRTWADLTNPRLLGEVALADPTKSGAIATAIEMIIQQQIHQRLAALQEAIPDPQRREEQAVREGWNAGLRILQLVGANSRYFTDSSQKPPIDVSQGNAAVGLCIDFYGRYQEEAITRRKGGSRLIYISPVAGSVYSVDPIALLRGAPHREAAQAFIEYVLSMDGQKLWNFRVGAPGGPVRFALRRLPVRRDFYTEPDFRPFRSDPDARPFEETNPLVYHPEWTAPLFREMAFIIRVMCLDTHRELRHAWAEIVAAGMPEGAMRKLTDLSAVTYDRALGDIRSRLNSKNRIDELTLARELAAAFRRNYAEAAQIARQARK